MSGPHKLAGTILCNTGALIALAGIQELALLHTLYSGV